MRRLSELLTIFFLTFFLSGCFSGTDVTREEFQGDTYTISVISNWHRLTSQDFNEDIPSEAVAAFLSSDPAINLSIVREFLDLNVSSIEYAHANIVNAEKQVLNYEKINVEEVTMSDIETKIHTFKGKSAPSDLLLKFIQAYIVKDKVGYTITGTLYPDGSEEEIAQLKDMILSFKFKAEPSKE